MKSVSLLPLLLLWISVIGQSLGNNVAVFNNLSSLEKCTSERDIRKGFALDFCPIPTVPYRAHEQLEFDKINSDRSGHNSLQDDTKSGVVDVVNFLAEISNGLKDWTAKVDVAEVLNTTLSSIQNGFDTIKSFGSKFLVWDMSNVSTIASCLMVVLMVVCVSIVFMPRLPMQLFLSLVVGCLYLCFACRRCGELFARYRELRRRRDPNGIAQGGRGNLLPVVRLIYDTAHLVYEDTRRWHRNNWKHLNDAVEAHLLRFWSPQGEIVRDPIEPGMLVLGPAMNYQRVWGPIEMPPEEAMPNYQHIWGPVERPPDEANVPMFLIFLSVIVFASCFLFL